MIKALVVDDSEAMRKSIMYALQKLGDDVVCVEAQDGADGFKKFSQERYDLVVTDINMPLMDGLKLIHCIRQGQHAVPIVVITTEGAAEDRDRAMNLGASAYLVKPVQAQQVLDAVKGLLQL
jgi:two-component system, chemotaxis family, chemotaxis protein CheY